MAEQQIYDIAVIGGGINGCGVARDAAGRGLKVYLAEQGDLAQGTSSASTKLIHGGLRYLEYYEFRLVREALFEREVLLRNAPHIIWPLRFVLPHHSGLRPAWFLRLGLFIYDHMGGRKLLPGTRTLDLRADVAGQPLVERFTKGFEYSDCWVDDARLVVLNAKDAAARGARVETRTRVIGAVRRDGLWDVSVARDGSDATQTVVARSLVNAAGPWVDEVVRLTGASAGAQRNVRLVRGSHIVVPRMFEHDRAYIFQNKDGRIFFAIPYEQDFTLIGTTDADHREPLAGIHASDEEIDYLCAASSEYFRRPIERRDVVWTYSGVRPLYDDGASAAHQATRDYVLKVETENGHAPLLNVFGGKITTFRRLAGKVLSRLGEYIPVPASDWTKHAALPGGDFDLAQRGRLLDELKNRYPFLAESTVERLMRSYGSLAYQVLGDAGDLEALGEDFGAGLSEAEVGYLMDHEWARELDDVIWRRSKLGLRLSDRQKARLEAWMKKRKSLHNDAHAAA
ncbi:MAG: glycerol-3-phosphate dehydrogenase [Gammaproteobacteria bacterium]|nr:glycerol-3-phosphate dehydrogenase [Gammaproteobacteria bacterium]